MLQANREPPESKYSRNQKVGIRPSSNSQTKQGRNTTTNHLKPIFQLSLLYTKPSPQFARPVEGGLTHRKTERKGVFVGPWSKGPNRSVDRARELQKGPVLGIYIYGERERKSIRTVYGLYGSVENFGPG